MQSLHYLMQPLHYYLFPPSFLSFFAYTLNISAMTATSKPVISRADREKQRALARSLYLSGMEQKEISEKIGASRTSVSKWCVEGNWKEIRAAKSVTRTELVNKLLLTIDSLITQVNASGDPTLLAGLGDKLTKLASAIEKLDKKAGVVDVIEVFMDFSRFLEQRAQSDRAHSVDLLKAINRYQDIYVTSLAGLKQ